MDEWTVESLRVHLESEIHSLAQRLDDRIEALHRETEFRWSEGQAELHAQLRATLDAIDKLEQSTNHRLEQLNEARKTLNDVLAATMPRSEAEGLAARNLDLINALQARVEQMSGRTLGSQALLGWLTAATAVAVAIVSILIDHVR